MQSLKSLRKEQNLTLEELSEKTGITIATLSNLEKGKNTPHTDTRLKLSKELGVINWLDTPYIEDWPRGPECTWIDAERSFRSLIHEITSLGKEEQKAFCEAAIRHLKRIMNN